MSDLLRSRSQVRILLGGVGRAAVLVPLWGGDRSDQDEIVVVVALGVDLIVPLCVLVSIARGLSGE
jgi:hypothetical protein